MTSPLVCDSLQWVHELGTLSGLSGKFKAILENTYGSGPSATLKPLWESRQLSSKSIRREKKINMKLFKISLEAMASKATDTGPSAKANGLSL